MTNRVIIFDTTLRDGEQSPGASMTLQEKLRIAAMLDAAGVDVIEAGFPAASAGDFEAVAAIAKQLKNASAAALARAVERDIVRAGEALKGARQPRIHTFIATSPLHMAVKLNLSPEQVLERIASSVGLARQYTNDVEWSCEDGTRSEIDFLCRAIETAIKAGATTINVPDTVGYTLPEVYFDLITTLRTRVPNADKAVFSTHCHDDLGLAVANSLAGVRAGARQIECTINGLGERAGNAALEEVVMALRVRNDVLPFVTNIQTTHLARLSAAVSEVTGFPVTYNKAVVGKNAFAHESGIHQDGMLKNAQTYEIMRPEDVGVLKTSLVLGKHSGRHALIDRLRALGLADDLTADSIDQIFARFKTLADRKKNVYDDDLRALFLQQNLADTTGEIELQDLQLTTKLGQPPHATVVLNIGGTPRSASSTGDGPIDALFQAVSALLPHQARLESYSVQAVSADSDAQARATVRLRDTLANHSVTGHAADPDTHVASVKAYIQAVQRLNGEG